MAVTQLCLEKRPANRPDRTRGTEECSGQGPQVAAAPLAREGWLCIQGSDPRGKAAASKGWGLGAKHSVLHQGPRADEPGGAAGAKSLGAAEDGRGREGHRQRWQPGHPGHKHKGVGVWRRRPPSMTATQTHPPWTRQVQGAPPHQSLHSVPQAPTAGGWAAPGPPPPKELAAEPRGSTRSWGTWARAPRWCPSSWPITNTWMWGGVSGLCSSGRLGVTCSPAGPQQSAVGGLGAASLPGPQSGVSSVAPGSGLGVLVVRRLQGVSMEVDHPGR